jgi:hypothetical protein
MQLPAQHGVETLASAKTAFHVGGQAIPLSPAGAQAALMLAVPLSRDLPVLIIERGMLAIPLVVIPRPVMVAVLREGNLA